MRNVDDDGERQAEDGRGGDCDDSAGNGGDDGVDDRDVSIMTSKASTAKAQPSHVEPPKPKTTGGKSMKPQSPSWFSRPYKPQNP